MKESEKEAMRETLRDLSPIERLEIISLFCSVCGYAYYDGSYHDYCDNRDGQEHNDGF